MYFGKHRAVIQEENHTTNSKHGKCGKPLDIKIQTPRTINPAVYTEGGAETIDDDDEMVEEYLEEVQYAADKNCQGKNKAPGKISLKEPKPKKIHACPICGRCFADPYKIRRHVEGVHEGVKRFSCSLCEQKFHRKYHLDRHIQRAHKSFEPFDEQPIIDFVETENYLDLSINESLNDTLEESNSSGVVIKQEK